RCSSKPVPKKHTRERASTRWNTCETAGLRTERYFPGSAPASGFGTTIPALRGPPCARWCSIGWGRWGNDDDHERRNPSADDHERMARPGRPPAYDLLHQAPGGIPPGG